MPELNRILIVDDDAQDRAAVARILQREGPRIGEAGVEVQEAETIAAAREALRREEFACVFLDHELPDGTSLDLLTEIRNQGLATPVVVLTGQRDEETVMQAMEAGAVDYLPKDRLRPDLVARSLRAALRFLQIQREKQAILDDLRARDRAVAAASNGIVISDPRQPDCPLVYVNAAFLQMTGYSEDEVLGRNCRFLQGPSTDPAAVKTLGDAIRAEQSCQELILNYRKDGTTFWNEVTISPVRDAHARVTHFVGVQTDVTERQKAEDERAGAEQALQEAHARTEAILASITEAFFALDSEWRFTYINDESERIMGRPREELLGRDFWEAYAPALGTIYEREYRRATREQTPVSFEAYYPPLRTWTQVRALPSASGLSVFYHDVTEQKIAEAALERSREDLRLAIDAARLGTFYCEYPLDKIIWNDTCKEHFFLPLDAEVDISLFYSLLHPDDREGTQRAIERAEAEHVKYDVEYRTVGPQGQTRWVNAVGRFYYNLDGAPTRFDGITIDISERKATEKELRERIERERFLASLAERARVMTDPDEVIADAVDALGRFLGVTSCVFDDIDMEAGCYLVRHQYRSDDSVPRIEGSYTLDPFGAYLVAELSAGRTVAVQDTYADPVAVPPASIAAYDSVGIRAHASAPVVHSARLMSFISCHSLVPRVWTPDEVTLIQTVVERTWLTVEVLRQQQALAREAEAQRARAEREALLNRINAAIRMAREPEQVLRAAVREIGEALNADRCYFSQYDQDADTATIDVDWRRVGLPSMVGRYRMSDFTVNRDPGYQAGQAQAVADTASDPALQALGMRALLRVPLAAGREMTALAVAMVSGARAWTTEDVALVEAVATQVQTALEALQIQRREHQIAQQLQDALQPALPENVPGLSMGWFTRPALDEAEVGGDFFDVFPLDKDLHALVLGDVSGKGLGAAQQLALIRNSLRTTLYLRHDPAQAATTLNNVVTAHDLLVGFVTVWIGLYNAVTGSIVYCSCGHEPGLVRRAGGAGMETLVTTGPPLGVKGNITYVEEKITLAAGDALLLYTDGLSEAGPSRRQLLGTDGLRDIFADLPSDADAQRQARALVENVGQFSGGVFRDDVAVLLLIRR